MSPAAPDRDADRAGTPVAVTAADVMAARARLAGRLRRTPLLETTLDTVGGPVDVVFKLEYTQLGGCFKVRGSLNAVLDAVAHDTLPEAGVLVASGGNAALGAAWAARLVGVPATVVVPETAPAVKISALRSLGATVRLIGTRYQESADAAAALAADSGALLLHAYDLPTIVAGAGTIGLEVAEDLPGHRLQTVACVGGGGLLAGLAATLRPGDRLIGAEPIGASCLDQARAAGEPVTVELDSIAADSLGASRVGGICWATIADRAVDSVVVDDADLIAARRMMWDRFRIVIEHGTATAVAAVTTGAVEPATDSTLCIVLCGANTRLDDLHPAQ
ncbi:serine/threonine dehydratase [Gordonia sp. i37]|uniref:serine/threonine dehydratase n=1 Tax=Gordonia sp. i37 TaxID=1961707 RepID=UPI0009ADF0EB|nr:serine/threonine dehydratase [Gordonia sp. i37]OPX16157.1 pyridoxal-5'-phosphate-dependent protein subunit beta [Gordonia sp. i37]